MPIAIDGSGKAIGATLYNRMSIQGGNKKEMDSEPRSILFAREMMLHLKYVLLCIRWCRRWSLLHNLKATAYLAHWPSLHDHWARYFKPSQHLSMPQEHLPQNNGGIIWYAMNMELRSARCNIVYFRRCDRSWKYISGSKLPFDLRRIYGKCTWMSRIIEGSRESSLACGITSYHLVPIDS